MFGLPTLTPGPPFSTRVKPISAEMIVWVLVVVGHSFFICIAQEKSWKEEIDNFDFVIIALTRWPARRDRWQWVARLGSQPCHWKQMQKTQAAFDNCEKQHVKCQPNTIIISTHAHLTIVKSSMFNANQTQSQYQQQHSKCFYLTLSNSYYLHWWWVVIVA